MEVQSPAVKRHYDITMSRRTRKQQQQQSSMLQKGNEKPKSATKEAKVTVETKTTQTVSIGEVKEISGKSDDHKSLKQLIKGDDHKEAKKGDSEDQKSKGSRNSLGEHFSEEEKQHLQLVRMQQKENLQGLNFNKLVRRYAKVLGHLMKAKSDPRLGDAGIKPAVFKLSS